MAVGPKDPKHDVKGQEKQPFSSGKPPSREPPPHRFAGGEGAQRRSCWRIFGFVWNSADGPYPQRAGRSVADTYHRPHQRKQGIRRTSGGSERERRGPGTSVRREWSSGPDRSTKLKEPASGQRRGGIKQPYSESDARAW